MSVKRFFRMLAMAGAFLMLNAQPVLACAACFGKSDSAMAKGMNMGILSLLVVITSVLGGVASFFIYLARRQPPGPSQFEQREHETETPELTNKL